MHFRWNRHAWGRAGLISSAVVLAGLYGCERTQSPTSTQPVATTTSPAVDLQARECLNSCAEVIQNASTLSVEITGQTAQTREDLESGLEVRLALALHRPDHLIVRILAGEGGAQVLADGSRLVAVNTANTLYSEEPQQGGIAELSSNEAVAEAFTGGALGFCPSFLKENITADLLDGVLVASYAGREQLKGQLTHHLHFVQARLDWDLWIAAQGDALPLQIVLDRSKSAKAPRPGAKARPVWMRVQFANWKLNPTLPADTFTLSVPATARKVESLHDAKQEASPLVGQPAPVLKVPLLSGGQVDLAEHKGKNVVVLDFFATWCEPCKKALPVLQEVTESFRSRGVVFYAIDREEPAEVIEKFLKAHPELKLTVGLDESGSAGDRFQVEGIPRSVLIGKDGRVQSIHVGYSDRLRERLERELKVLVEGGDLASERAAATQTAGTQPSH